MTMTTPLPSPDIIYVDYGMITRFFPKTEAGAKLIKKIEYDCALNDISGMVVILMHKSGLIVEKYDIGYLTKEQILELARKA